MSTEYIFLWLLFSAVAGYVASQKGRGFAGFFFISLIISPLITILILIALPEPTLSDNAQQNKVRPCPFCAEYIMHEAIKCKHCGSEVEKFENLEKNKECSVPKDDWITVTCPGCHTEDLTPYPMNTAYYSNFHAKEHTFSSAINLSCKFCGHKFKYQR